jgi:raffinose/stachyose/melibiose transport system substrate-binding protein
LDKYPVIKGENIMERKTVGYICLIFIVFSMLSCSKVANTAGRDTETIELVFMSTEKGDNTPLGVSYREARARFLADNPDIILVDNSVPHDDYDVKIKAAIVSNKLPDVFSGLADTIFAMADNGQIKPVDEYLALFPGWKETFMEGIFKDYTGEDGKIWAIPSNTQGCTFLYANLEILNECGISDIPHTLDELMLMIERTKAKGYIPIAMGNKPKFPLVGPFMSGFADRYTGSDWFYSMLRGEGARFTDPEFRKAVEVLDKVAKAGGFNEDINSIDETQSMNLYINRKAAMIISGGWGATNITQLAPPELVNVTTMAITPSVPDGKGDPRMVGTGSWTFQINGNLQGRKLEKAVELIKYMLDDDAIRIAVAGGDIRYARNLPADVDLSNVPRMTRLYIDLMDNAVMGPNYAVLLPPAMMEEFGNCCQELAVGAISVDTFITRMDTVHQETLAEKNL